MANALNKFMAAIGLQAEMDDEYGMDEGMEIESVQEEAPKAKRESRKGKIVNMPTNGADRPQVMVYKPMDYEEIRLIIDHLKEQKMVFVILEHLQTDVALRMLDFMSGAVHALNGNFKRLSDGIYILTPAQVVISTNMPEELKSHRSFGRRE
jgi:cell division inhibitor SepF